MRSAQELGALLKEARQAKKLAVGDLSEKTGLPERYLEALEAGDHDALPGKAYARIYYLNYARVLELDTETLMLDWPHPEGDPVPPPSVQPPNPWPKRILIAIGIIVAIVITYSVWQSRDIAAPPMQPVVTPEADDTTASIDSVMDTTATDSVIDTVSQALPAAPPEQPAQPPPTYALEVQARGQSWVVIEADGDTVEAKVLPGGGSMRAEASNDFVLTATRPEVVRVLLDGKEVSLPQDRTRPLIRHRIDPKAEGGTP